jgi:hypothetical protein
MWLINQMIIIKISTSINLKTQNSYLTPRGHVASIFHGVLGGVASMPDPRAYDARDPGADLGSSARELHVSTTTLNDSDDEL